MQYRTEFILPITLRISDKSELGMFGSLAQDQSACTQRLGSWWPNRRQLANTALWSCCLIWYCTICWYLTNKIQTLTSQRNETHINQKPNILN